MTKNLFARWQANFWTGLAVVLPGIISVALLVWLFSSISRITDLLLFFLPYRLTHDVRGDGSMYWYWSVMALLLAAFLIGLVGLLARNYFGNQIIKLVDSALLRIPLLNKVYGATKQINDAFSSSNKTSFRTVVLIEFPHPGVYSLGFITSEQPGEPAIKLAQKLVCVFVPATPNPTSGFLLLAPPEKVTRLEMSVADGIKYIISIGSIIPEYAPLAQGQVSRSPAALNV